MSYEDSIDLIFLRYHIKIQICEETYMKTSFMTVTSSPSLMFGSSMEMEKGILERNAVERIMM